MVKKDSILVNGLKSAFVCWECGRPTGHIVDERKVVFRCICGFEIEFSWSEEFDAVVKDVLKRRV